MLTDSIGSIWMPTARLIASLHFPLPRCAGEEMSAPAARESSTSIQLPLQLLDQLGGAVAGEVVAGQHREALERADGAAQVAELGLHDAELAPQRRLLRRHQQHPADHLGALLVLVALQQ